MYLSVLLSSAIKLDYHPYSQNNLTVQFRNFMYASTYPLFWWWYDEVMVCSIFNCLQNYLNLSDMTFVPVSETISWGDQIKFCKHILSCSHQAIN